MEKLSKDHYTPLDIVIKCLKTISFNTDETILDPCSGTNMIWYDNFPENVKKEYTEIELDKDFFKYIERVNKIIGNPPYEAKLLWKFIEHSMEITDNIYYLLNVSALNVFTKKRYKLMSDTGFNIVSIKFIEVPKWYGRYVFINIKKDNTQKLIDYIY